MVTPDISILAIAGLMAAAVTVWAIPDGRGCSHCPHCLAERDAHYRAQRDLRHDLEHKGFGFRQDTPDRFACRDERCPRNEPMEGPNTPPRVPLQGGDPPEARPTSGGGPEPLHHADRSGPIAGSPRR
jgi:hypothetical protein